MFKKRLIRATCTALVLTIMPLATLFAVGSYLGWFSGAGLLSPDNPLYTPMRWDRDKIDLSQQELQIQIDDLIGAIDQLPELEDLQLSDKPLIMDALAQYLKIPELERPRVHNYPQLEDAMERIEELEQESLYETFEETGPDTEEETGPDTTEDTLPDTTEDTVPDTTEETIPGISEGVASGGEMGGDIPTDRVMFCLRTSDLTGRLYLKQMSYGSFVGQGWTAAVEYPGLINVGGTQYSAEYLPWLGTLLEEPMHEVRIDPLSNNIRLNPYYMAHGGNAFLQTSDIQALGNASSSYVLYLVQPNDSAFPMTDPALVLFEEEYRSFVYENYTYVDPETSIYMNLLIMNSGFDADSPDIIQSVAEYIQNAATYDLYYDRSMDEEENVVIAFLNDYKTGVCRHYAASATLLYRALGIPARYTVGFAANAEAGQSVNVTGMEAHAWVEVYVDGFGWQVVEVTGGSSIPGPGPDETETETESETETDPETETETEPETDPETEPETDPETEPETEPETDPETETETEPETEPVITVPIKLKIDNEDILYDGRKHTFSNKPVWEEFEEKLRNLGYDYEYDIIGISGFENFQDLSFTEPGKGTVAITNLRIYRNNRTEDITEYFDFSEFKEIPGKGKNIATASLQVYLATLVVEYDTITLTYNGQPQTGSADQYRIDFEKSADKANMTVDQFKAMIDARGITLPEARAVPQTDVGTYKRSSAVTVLARDQVTGRDRSNAFRVEYSTHCGTVTIEPIPLVLYALSATRPYEADTPLTEDRWDYGYYDVINLKGSATDSGNGNWIKTDKIEGHTVSAQIAADCSQLAVGRSSNRIDPGSLKILDEQGKDVSQNYSIFLIDGLLRVTPARS